ncbi:MAG: hypothetical protein QHC67_10515 [Sphingobium sp.]|nr:hypothetical protein [Sphingobium sp.]MDX3910238.1 hypothetical protein [Sphingobium sp.]
MPVEPRRPAQPFRTPSASTLQAAAAIFGSAIINNDSRFRVTGPQPGQRK